MYNIVGEKMSEKSELKGKKPIKVSSKTNDKIENNLDKNSAKKPIKVISPKNDNNLNFKKIFKVGICVMCVIAVIIIVSSLTKPSIESLKNSVVMLEVYDDNGELLGTGSGFCAYKSNYIVTNFHVIEGANSIVVITDDKESYDVNEILIFDYENDLAILDAEVNLKPLKLGNVSNLSAGDKVTAIGSPLGELNTVSTGIISNAENDRGIQITASISPGSSGGALFNKRNQLIGITYATLSNGQNLNYAISLDYLEDLYSALKKNNFYLIEDEYYESCMLSYNGLSFDGCVGATHDYYSPYDFDVFSKVTNLQERYNYELDNGSWGEVYYDLSSKDRKQAFSYYKELEEIYFCEHSCDVENDIKNWDVNEFMINLGVLNKKELAFVLTDIDNYNNDYSKFNRVEEYPLEAAEKALILYLIGDRKWNNIHVDNKEDIFNYFDQKYGTEDLGAILELLGYDVRYNSDGTLTAWW